MGEDKTIYPKTETKIVHIDKEGYNSMSVLNATETTFEVQLYNPNREPEEAVAEAAE